VNASVAEQQATFAAVVDGRLGERCEGDADVAGCALELSVVVPGGEIEEYVEPRRMPDTVSSGKCSLSALVSRSRLAR
jgi:hypothetical protein